MPTKRKILIIEDEQTLLKALDIKFNEAGFDVATAIDGQSGLELANQVKPDIILLDIILPTKDGLTVLEELKQNEETESIPVLLLTNLSDQASISRGVELGAAGYIIKADFSLDEVVQKVESTLAAHPPVVH